MNLNRRRDGFALSFRATELEARAGICAVASQLKERGLSEDKAGDVEIALAEAINNVVEHAYTGIEPGKVRVRCTFHVNRLDVRICDMGHPLPSNQLPAGEAANLDVDRQDLPEGGFGWFMIRQIASDISYQREEGHNLLSLGFDLPCTQP
ncbi:ATP-binding protein [Phaeobacter gallaeciensis]|uniref:ATP-binding protein n=2 Tax=Roseobacteraceae TaxID=2854170 RepID=A0A366X5M8_9RHOB|nr:MULTISPECIES: ATP-binding protein [Roseobacteraceae]MBT3141889.1 ATP-binding protein [Falsiruegeria litorea]MBT8168764.1 ATP-binding protein [Falsiruegeria litorea]RBW60099.1 ATP-binding protein [Phaeobacter gallaeciensis]